VSGEGDNGDCTCKLVCHSMPGKRGLAGLVEDGEVQEWLVREAKGSSPGH
jgi:hypothetical protein